MALHRYPVGQRLRLAEADTLFQSKDVLANGRSGQAWNGHGTDLPAGLNLPNWAMVSTKPSLRQPGPCGPKTGRSSSWPVPVGTSVPPIGRHCPRRIDGHVQGHPSSCRIFLCGMMTVWDVLSTQTRGQAWRHPDTLTGSSAPSMERATGAL